MPCARKLISNWFTNQNAAGLHQAHSYQTPASFSLHLATSIARCTEGYVPHTIARANSIDGNNQKAFVA